MPLNGQPAYDTSYVSHRQVAKDCLVAYRGNRYSVPHVHAGKNVVVRELLDSGTIRIFSQQELIAEHRLSTRRGEMVGVPLFQEQLLRIAMTVADFSGAEADELRRAVGKRRSWERMKNLEGKLRAGMTTKGLDAKRQDTIVQQISSFALYGFPESHAASFALIAYASAYFKVKYLAAFTAAILNNQPMGFYSPAVLVKDAQRHGLRVKPIDVQVSDWPCSVEHESDGTLSLRIGLGYAKNLAKQAADALVTSRRIDGPFRSAEDLTKRVPALNRRELTRLAQIGAMNQVDGIEHRRDALWQVERAGKLEGPLFREDRESLREDSDARPLRQMNVEERLVADYTGTGLTVGKHPMHYRRAELRAAISCPPRNCGCVGTESLFAWPVAS
jgi:error-prone DNA polymerase